MNLSEDRIIKFLDACYDAGIKSPDAFLISKMPQVYNYLKGCFPRGILPTDIDGEVEINGHFLRLEFKHETALRNGRVPNGQMKALRGLIDTKRFTVMLIGTDDKSQPTCAQIWYEDGKIISKENCDVEWFRSKCSGWSKYAEAFQVGKIKNI